MIQHESDPVIAFTGGIGAQPALLSRRRMPLTVRPPHRLDLSLPAWLGAVAALRHNDATAARGTLEGVWAPAGDGLAFLSVRSAFDCALTVLDWPAGTEVLVSAVNIREMIELLSLHGLVAVPLDLDRETLLPTPEAIESARTPATRGLLLAHLFGAAGDVGPLFERARASGLFCFEDAAQAFQSPAERGHPLADLSFFSFGTIKTATALGGALVRVAAPSFRARMAEVQAAWPMQPRSAYGAKLARALMLLGVQTTLGYSLLARACALVGSDTGALMRRMTRGFGGLPPSDMLRALRHRPCAPLLAVLLARLASFDGARLKARRAWGLEIVLATSVPGAAHSRHAHWLIPVRVPHIETALATLRAGGFDASGPSNVCALGGAVASDTLAHLVFIPAYPELPRSARRKLLQLIEAFHADPGILR